MQTTTEQQAGDFVRTQTVVTAWMREVVEEAGGEHGRVRVTRDVTSFGTFVVGMEAVTG